MKVMGRFYLPVKGCKPTKYNYIPIEIKKSTIAKAGKGAFAVEGIPKGYLGIYTGTKKKRYEDINPFYSWEVTSFDPKTGEMDNRDIFLYYIDASTNKSNWTKYVNCGMKSKYNNMECVQCYGKVYYLATRNIKPGEELFIDYGEGYRVENLGLSKSKY